jgi:phospholipid transport system substrate-binding protein
MKRWACTSIWLLGSLFALQVMAAASPEDVVKSTTDQVLARVKNDEAALKADTSKLYALVNEVIIPHFDFERASQLVLGRYWRTADDAQRTRFENAFKELMVRTYANALFQYVDQKINYKPSLTDADGQRAVVRTEIIKPGETPIPVNYRMHLMKNGEWKVYDVFVDGISLIVTYRDSFASEIRQSGLDSLITHMRNHNQKLTAKSDSQ